MWTDAESDEKGRGGEYGADYDYAAYDQTVPDNLGYEDAAYGDGGWKAVDERAYWRRRFLILAGGVVALAACAWMLPGAHQPSKAQAAAARASAAAQDRKQALPPAATGPSAHTKPLAGAAPTTAAAAVKPKPKQADAAGQPKAAASPKAAACDPADIVLSLSTSQSAYPKGAHPRFSVYAVSTSAAPCALSYGAGAVEVVVTKAGHVVWDSTACEPKPKSKVGFELGVPQELTLIWNTLRTTPAGCAGTLPAGTSGTLSAVAMSHGQSSPVRTFKLTG
jgi:hypothetical protein